MTAEVNGQIVKTYESNPQLRAVGQRIGVTAFQLDELKKCAADFNYFAENYCKILSLGSGLVNFKLRGYQSRVAENVLNNRFNIVMWCRQSGKTTLVAALLCWEVLFKRDWTIAILANKADQAREIVGRIQMMYENLPFWMQKGVKAWNKGSFNLENNSRIFSAATSASGIRGRSCVSGDTMVTVRNKASGVVEHITMNELRGRIGQSSEPLYNGSQETSNELPPNRILRFD